MLTTHNFRTYSPSVMQTPLCQSLKANVPNYIICSNTIKISQLVWVDGHYPEKSQLELDLAEDANETYLKLGALPKHMEFETVLIDPCISNVFFNSKDTGYLTLSVAPCMGVLNEFNNRLNKLMAHKQQSEYLNKIVNQTIEHDSERFYLHGEFIEKHKGSLKLLKYPLESITVDSSFSTASTDKPRLVINFEITNSNSPKSGISTNLPSIPFFGSIINSDIQPKLTKPREFNFAVGFKHWNPPQNRFNDYLDDFLDLGFFECLLVIEVVNENEANEIIDLFSHLNLTENLIRNIRCDFTSDLPAANWICFADGEVIEFLKDNPDKDALDAMLYIAKSERYTVITTSGYGLLSKPRNYPSMPNVNGEHAWAESLYKLTYLKSDFFKSQYLMRLNQDNEDSLYWEHSKL